MYQGPLYLISKKDSSFRIGHHRQLPFGMSARFIEALLSVVCRFHLRLFSNYTRFRNSDRVSKQRNTDCDILYSFSSPFSVAITSVRSSSICGLFQDENCASPFPSPHARFFHHFLAVIFVSHPMIHSQV